MNQGIKIIPTKHFIERLGERYFNLSVISKLHVEMIKNPLARVVKVTHNNATIVASIRPNGTARLITGYIGGKK